MGWLLQAVNCNNEKIAVESNSKRVSNVFRAIRGTVGRRMCHE